MSQLTSVTVHRRLATLSGQQIDETFSEWHWTFGGGDIFGPDPQYLGYASPRLSEVTEGISPGDVEGAGFVTLTFEASCPPQRHEGAVMSTKLTL